MRAHWNLYGDRSFDCARKSGCISDRTIAGYAAGQFGCAFDIGTLQKAFDALVGVAEPGFQADYGFSVRVEAKVSRLDDARVDWSDGNLMQAFAFGGQEAIGPSVRAWSVRSQRMTHTPATMIEPGTRVGCILRFNPKQIADGAFQPNRRRMPFRDRREAPLRTWQTYNSNSR